MCTRRPDAAFIRDLLGLSVIKCWNNKRLHTSFASNWIKAGAEWRKGKTSANASYEYSLKMKWAKLAPCLRHRERLKMLLWADKREISHRDLIQMWRWCHVWLLPCPSEPLHSLFVCVCVWCIQGTRDHFKHFRTLNEMDQRPVQTYSTWQLVCCDLHPAVSSLTQFKSFSTVLAIYLFFLSGPGSKKAHLIYLDTAFSTHEHLSFYILHHFTTLTTEQSLFIFRVNVWFPRVFFFQFPLVNRSRTTDTLYACNTITWCSSERWIRGHSEMKSSYLTYFTARISKWHNLKREET